MQLREGEVMSEVPPRSQNDSLPLPKHAAEPRTIYCENSLEGGTLTLHSNRLVRDVTSPSTSITVLRSAIGALVEEQWWYRPTLALGILLMVGAAAAGGYTGANQALQGLGNAQGLLVVEGIAFAVGAVLSLLRWKRWLYVLRSPAGYVWMEWTVVGGEPEWASTLKQWLAKTHLNQLE